MILKLIPHSRVDTIVVKLPESDMIVDPRPIDIDENFKFKVSVKGTSMTVTRIGRKENQSPGWEYDSVRFRAYKSDEFRHSFKSGKYLLHGLEYERAPLDATEVIVKDGIDTINYGTFYGCKFLTKVHLPKSVKRIENCAFYDCVSLQFVQLPPNLEYIGNAAFGRCSSLRAMHIPSTVAEIGDLAFVRCKSLRAANISENVTCLGDNVLFGCEADLLTKASDKQKMQWLRNRYNPLHNLCSYPSVSAEEIQEYIQGHHENEELARTKDKPKLTALHLLAANPSVTAEMISAFVKFAPDVAVLKDDLGATPLHTLCSLPYFFDSTADAIRAYLGCCEGKKAASMRDRKGRTPLQCLFEKASSASVIFETKSFGGLIPWWYDCLGVKISAEELEMNLLTMQKSARCCFWIK